MYRKVTGTVLKAIGKPGEVPAWKNAHVIFRLIGGNYDGNNQYPSITFPAKTDDSGHLETQFWCNEEGYQEGLYRCTLPDGHSFDFALPSGTAPIDLSVLREGGGMTPSNPQYPTLVTYFENYIDNLVIPGNETYQVLVSSGQPTFNLLSTPSQPQKTRLYLNGIKQKYGVDFNINGLVLNWLSNPIPNDYLIEVYYL